MGIRPTNGSKALVKLRLGPYFMVLPKFLETSSILCEMLEAGGFPIPKL